MRVLVCADYFEDGCGWYRSLGPWSQIARTRPDIDVIYSTKPGWGDVRSCDVLFLQRPATQVFKNAMNAAKQFGVKVVVDMDDDLFSIPRDNHSYEPFRGLQLEMKNYITHADLVMVSTLELRKKFSEWNKNVHVVPNALDESLLKFRQTQPANNLVLWRGTATHNRDVATVSSQIVAIAKKYPEYKFAFVGADPCAWDVSEKIKDAVVITAPMAPATFFQTLCILRPKILITPLQDIPFNRAKSNIAAIEASLCGAACVAPNWPQWIFDGVTTYGNPTDFGEKLERLMSGSLNPSALADDALRYVKNYFSLSAVNRLRLSMIEELKICPEG